MKNKFYLLIIFLAVALLFPIQKSEAQIPFGGNIIMSYECACSGGWYVLVFDKKTLMPTPLVFELGVSRLNANYNIFSPKTSLVGSYTPGGICLKGTHSCKPKVVLGTITPFPFPGVGTSIW